MKARLGVSIAVRIVAALLVLLSPRAARAVGEGEVGGGIVVGRGATAAPVGEAVSARFFLRPPHWVVAFGLGLNATTIGFEDATPDYPDYAGRVSTLWVGPLVRGTLALTPRAAAYAELGFGAARVSDDHDILCSTTPGLGPAGGVGVVRRIRRVALGGSLGWHAALVTRACLPLGLTGDVPQEPQVIGGLASPLHLRATAAVCLGKSCP